MIFETVFLNLFECDRLMSLAYIFKIVEEKISLDDFHEFHWSVTLFQKTETDNTFLCKNQFFVYIRHSEGCYRDAKNLVKQTGV